MSTTVIFATGGLIALILAFALWRTHPRQGLYWALAWLSLQLSGVLHVLANDFPALRVVYPPLGTAFPAFLYAGSCVFAGRAPPRWLWPAFCVVALARGAIGAWAPFAFTQIGAIVLISAGGIAACLCVGRRAFRPGGGLAERALAISLPFVGVASVAYETTRGHGEDLLLAAFFWLVIGSIVAGFQVAALLEDVARRVADDRATLAALVESVPLGLALIDSQGGLTRHNSVFASLAGFAPEAAGGAPQARRIAEGLSDSAAERTALASQDLELSLRGGARVVSLQRPVRDASGAEIGRLWMLRDVTTERQLEAELRLARQLETVARLAGGVAHDFNNQLTVVLGNAAQLESAFAAEDPRAAQLRDIQRAAEHCAAITRDLLDFARQSPSQRSAVDLAEVAREAAAQRGPQLPREVTVNISVEPGVPRAHADRAQLRRVLDNLLANAVQAVGERGAVEVSVRASKGTTAQVELAVADDGPGMSDEVRERIFDPFFTTKRDAGGTGLGLAIVHGIVAAHGGAVRVETNLHGGARFVTIWPAASSEAVCELSGARALTSPRSSLAALLVEDEPGVRRLVAGALRDGGHQVVEFATAEEALAALAGGLGRIDIAIVDLTLPGMSGAALIDELAKRRPGLPALLMSGHFTPPELPSVPFLAKPFRAQELLAAVSALLEARRAT